MGVAFMRVFASSAVMRGGPQSLAARRRSCSSVGLPGVEAFALVGSGCAVRSLRLARVRGSGLVVSLRDEAVAGVVIVCPSTQQPCGYSTSVKRYGGDTPTVAAISGTASAPQAFRGDASSRNEKSGSLASCLLVGGVLFRPLAIRHGVSPGHRGYDTPGSQKAPSTKKCIKTE